MGKDKFTGPSASSSAAKRSGVFLQHVDLVAVDPDAKDAFVPAEAWIEIIYENYESISIRKGVAGKRLCVRMNYSSTGPFREGTSWDDLRIFVNGIRLKTYGGRSNGYGTTFDFPLESAGSYPLNPTFDFPEEGEICFLNTAMNIQSRFRYKVNQ